MRANMIHWRDSASIIALARNKILNNQNIMSADYQILMQKRSENSGFLPNTVVFPGGTCESSDSAHQWIDHFKTFGITSEKLKEFQKPNIALPLILCDSIDSANRHVSLRITAIRETFEELGVLICRRRSEQKPYDNYWASHIEDFDVPFWQNKVHKDPLQFLELCQFLDCYPDIWSLYLWSNWLTPIKISSRRFNTVFFLTAFKTKPQVHTEKNEVSECFWSEPSRTLKAFKGEELILPPPQFYELSRLKYQNNIDSLLPYAASRSSLGCELFYPIRQATQDGILIALPGDDLYPINPDLINKHFLFSGDKTLLDLENHSKTVHRIHFKNVYDLEVKVQNYTPPYSHVCPQNENRKSQL